MVLVIGGKSQGKTKFAKDMFPEFDVLDEPSLPEILSCEKVTVLVDMKEGDGEAAAWGCDLTYDYVKINADYRS